MKQEDRDQMLELCRRITRETDVKRLALWTDELNVIIRRKLDELKALDDRAS